MYLSGKNILISIVLPFKNEEAFIRACIESILKQSHQHWELIAVDDHSTDQSFKIVEELAQNDSRIRLTKNEGSGLIDALVTAERFITGAFVSRMDADDLCSPNKYQKMLEQWEQKGDVVCGKVEYFSRGQLQDGFASYGKWINEVIGSENPWIYSYQECIIPSPSWLLHFQDLESIGGLKSASYPEDYDLALRLKQHQFQIKATDEVVHYWRDHPTRNSRTNPIYQNHFFPNIKWKYFLEIELRKEHQLILWGAGKRAKELARIIQKSNTAFRWISNNPQKIGQNIYDVIIESDMHYQSNKLDKIIAVVSAKNERIDLEQYFHSHGLEKGRDYWFFC